MESYPSILEARVYRLSRVLVTVIAWGGLAGCSQEPIVGSSMPTLTAGDTTPIMMDSSRYTLRAVTNGWQGNVRYVFTNFAQETVSLLNCNGQYALRLEQLQGTTWVDAWSPPVQECLSPPIQIPPEESLPGEIEIFAGRPGSNVYPQFSVPQIEGVYRLVIEAAYLDYDHSGPPWGETLPLEQRVSSPFEIRTKR